MVIPTPQLPLIKLSSNNILQRRDAKSRLLGRCLSAIRRSHHTIVQNTIDATAGNLTRLKFLSPLLCALAHHQHLPRKTYHHPHLKKTNPPNLSPHGLFSAQRSGRFNLPTESRFPAGNPHGPRAARTCDPGPARSLRLSTIHSMLQSPSEPQHLSSSKFII
jgi:hypothetical protein